MREIRDTRSNRHMSATGAKLASMICCAIQLACRVRCFGLPLYNVIAREALAAKLGLRLF